MNASELRTHWNGWLLFSAKISEEFWACPHDAPSPEIPWTPVELLQTLSFALCSTSSVSLSIGSCAMSASVTDVASSCRPLAKAVQKASNLIPTGQIVSNGTSAMIATEVFMIQQTGNTKSAHEEFNLWNKWNSYSTNNPEKRKDFSSSLETAFVLATGILIAWSCDFD
jgi:hypothetical protein